METSAKLFLDKEKELGGNIEELEGRLVDLNKDSASLCGCQSEKVNHLYDIMRWINSPKGSVS